MIAILDYICLGFKANIRKDAGVVERGGLEIRYTACCIGGSNPSLSAYTMKRIYPAEGKSSYCFKPMHIINA